MNSGQKPSTILLLRRQAALVLSLFLLTSLFAVTGSINIRANAEVFDGSGSDQVVAASGNNRFAVWYDGSQGRFDIFFSRSVDNGATWQSPVNLSNNLGESLHPQIAVSGSSVYVTWLQENAAGTQTDVFVKRSNNNGATWGGNVKLSSSGMNFGTLPQIAVSGSNAYVIWDEGTTGDVFMRRSTDNGATWKAIVNISNTGIVDLPQIAASGSNVFVTWLDTSTGNYETLLRRSADGGATWKAVKNLSNNVGDTSQSQIAVSGSNVYAVWLQRNAENTKSDVFVKRSTNNGATWGGNVKISASGTSFNTVPQIAVSGSNVYIAWHDRDVGDVFFRRSTDNGATWKAIVNISNNAGNSHDPKMFAVGSNVLMMWGDKTPGNEDILFKRSTDNGATWKAVMNLSSNPNDSFPGEIIG